MEANKQEIRRYLALGTQTDSELEQLIDRAISLADAAVCPKQVYGSYPCTPNADGVWVGNRFFAGRSLAKNLSGCDKVFLLAVTLGGEADRLLRLEAHRGASLGAVMQAVLTERLERECDRLQETLRNGLASDEALCPRFSPGYGDTALSDQESFFALLPITKTVGITLTDRYMMLPEKSVTAFLGIRRKGKEN